jgi:predicted ATPase
MFDNVARFLQQLAAASGLLFFIDDLHWADQGTLNLLHYLLRHLREERLLILAAYREVELDRAHPLAGALVEWNREHLATRITLARLSRADTGALLATLFGQASISDDFVNVLFRETEGNPFFIEEVVKSLIEQGEIYREDGGWGRKEVDELAIPQSVKEAIGRRLNRLSERCIEVLRCAAALGKIFPFDELDAVTQIGEDVLLDALDEASAAQLVRANSDDTFAFTHDKIREVLYEELNPIRRRRMHQRIGERLEQLAQTMPSARVRVQDLAYHFIQSGDLQRALKYSERAAQNAARLFALEEALSYYERAEEAAEALHNRERQAEIVQAMGDICSLQGMTPRAVAHYERAVALVKTASERGALHAKIGRDYAQVGDARGVRFLELALNELDPVTQSNELALATAALGRYHHYHAQHHRALEFLERALQIAEPSRDPETLSYLYLYLAGAYQHLLRMNESMEWARRAIALGEQENYPVSVANGNEFLGEDAMNQGRWQDALAHAQLDREIGEKLGALDRVAWADYIFSWARRERGDLELADEHGQNAYDLSERLGDVRLAIMTAALVSEIKTDRGAFDDALRIGNDALERSDALKHIVIQSLARNALAHFYITQGEWVPALEYLNQALELLAPTDTQWTRLVMAGPLTQAYLLAGKFEDALETANSNIARAQFAGSQHHEGRMRRVKGQILAAQGESDRAMREFDTAIGIHTTTDSRLDLAWDYQQRGLLQKSLGNIDLAEKDSEIAKRLFAECGAYSG